MVPPTHTPDSPSPPPAHGLAALHSLALRVEYLRALRGLEMAVIDRSIGVSQTGGYTSLIISGIRKRPGFNYVDEYARVLGTTTDWLTKGAGEPPRSGLGAGDSSERAMERAVEQLIQFRDYDDDEIRDLAKTIEAEPVVDWLATLKKAGRTASEDEMRDVAHKILSGTKRDYEWWLATLIVRRRAGAASASGNSPNDNGPSDPETLIAKTRPKTKPGLASRRQKIRR